MYVGVDLSNKQQILKALNPHRVITIDEQLRRFDEVKEYLIEAAMQAMAKAISHRHYKVGCAVWAFKTDTEYIEERWRVFKGANFKAQSDWPTVCAELVTAYAARCAGYDKIIGMAIAGEPQADDETNVLADTLRPCGKCRRALSVLPEIDETLTRVICYNPHTRLVEEFRFDELLKHYL